MNLEWIFLAEGFGTDSKGAPTAIGVNQNVIVTKSLPVRTKRGVTALFAVSPEEEGITATGTFETKSPSGATLAAHTAPVQVGKPQWKGVPLGVNMSAELDLLLSSYGAHTFTVTMQAPGGDAVVGSVDLYVVNPGEGEET